MAGALDGYTQEELAEVAGKPAWDWKAPEKDEALVARARAERAPMARLADRWALFADVLRRPRVELVDLQRGRWYLRVQRRLDVLAHAGGARQVDEGLAVQIRRHRLGPVRQAMAALGVDYDELVEQGLGHALQGRKRAKLAVA